jgi:hypothetical protein
MAGRSGGRLLLIDSKFGLVCCALCGLPQTCGTWVKTLPSYTRPATIAHMAAYPSLETSLYILAPVITEAISSLLHQLDRSRGESPYEPGALVIDGGVRGRHFPS